jgi:hypothetical protein
MPLWRCQRGIGALICVTGAGLYLTSPLNGAGGESALVLTCVNGAEVEYSRLK